MKSNVILKTLLLTTLAFTPLLPRTVLAHEHMDMAASDPAVNTSVKVTSTKAVLRDLWINHVFWVRSVVIAKASGNKAAEQAAESRVVANAQDIAGAIEPYYGTAAKDALFKLLAGHYGAVKAYLDASLIKSPAKQKVATEQLLENADQIATFLSTANPNLPKDTLLGLLQGHGGHHMTEIQQILAKDYKGEAQTWADMSQHMYMISDALVDGIAKQFPEKF